MDAIMLNCW